MSDEIKLSRVYSNGEINVKWRPELCVHCKACVNGLPNVFDIQKRPWVNMGGAATPEIRETIAQYPNGALRVTAVIS